MATLATSSHHHTAIHPATSGLRGAFGWLFAALDSFLLARAALSRYEELRMAGVPQDKISQDLLENYFSKR
ncbi:MAG: hypothetical protein AB7E70_17175 [Hyphomicrobiaceae bacterium]